MKQLLGFVLILAALSTSATDADIESAWKQLPAYQVGKDRASVLQLGAHITRTANDPKQKQANAKQLASLLGQSGTTDDAKLFICSQLAHVGSDAEVPAIAAVLKKSDKRSTQMAYVALVGINTQAAHAVLRNALDKATAETASDLIQAVGLVRDPKSVDLLKSRLDNPVTSKAALWALGEIGTDSAANVLSESKTGKDAAGLDANLRCAERLTEDGNKQRAQRIYESLLSPSNPLRYRIAALTGLVETGHISAPDHVATLINSPEPRLAAAATTLIPTAFAKADGEKVQMLIGKLPVQAQAEAIRALGEQGHVDIMPLVERAIRSQDDDLLLAAVQVLAKTGDASHVRTLVELAAKDDGDVASAAANSLAKMQADGVDNIIKKGLEEWPDPMHSVLIGVAAKRQSRGLSPTLLALAEKRPALRGEIYKALATIGTPDACQTLLKHLSDEMDTGTRKSLELAISVLARDDVLPVIQAWKNTKEHAKARAGILRIVAFIGGTDGLKPVRSALGSDDKELQREAIRALSRWPDAAAIDDLLTLLQAKDKFARTMAVRGLMRLVDKTSDKQKRLGILDTLARLPDKPAINDWAKKKTETVLKQDASEAAKPNARVSSAPRKPANEPAPKDAKRAANAKRILLITGEDYPKRKGTKLKGHVWQETAPALRDQLQKDTRLAVDLVDDLKFLRSKELAKYAAVVMHFKNYDPKVPGRAGYDNLASFVEKGGGLVLVHFACGAFQEFKDDFVKLVGRVWDPKLRGHDRFRTFEIEVTKPDHPALAGLKSFETTDELYTCLVGDTPIDVLASAVSNVDGKRHPMVFVLNYGKGRVFHCPLGHNVAALTNEPVAELFRRATAWAAGLEAVEKE